MLMKGVHLNQIFEFFLHYLYFVWADVRKKNPSKYLLETTENITSTIYIDVLVYISPIKLESKE